MTFSLSNQKARQVILHLQGLTREPHIKYGPGGLQEMIEQLGFVQVDSIQWVERAQHMTLFARNQTYRPKHLARLIEEDRSLFEHWTHDASVIPSRFYPYWKHRFERYREKTAKKFENWQGGGYRERCSEVLDQIEQNGFLRSRDVKSTENKPQEMWQWHDGKAALEYLWHTGQLCILAREGFQKVYGPAADGVPPNYFEQTVTHDEFIDWACQSALERLGFGTASDIARFWDIVSIREVDAWLAGAGKDVTVPIYVEGVKGQGGKQLIARGDIAAVVEELIQPPKRVRALSPFDPVIRDRKRLSWLFGFEYRIEIYVPEAKRKWGYYVFPLLEGNRLIGRIDMRAKRKEGVLEVKRLWLESGVKLSASRKSRVDGELTRQARLGGVQSVVWLDDALDSVVKS